MLCRSTRVSWNSKAAHLIEKRPGLISMAGRKSVWANEAAKRRASSRRQREDCRRLFAVMRSPQISNHEGIDVGLALFPFY